MRLDVPRELYDLTYLIGIEGHDIKLDLPANRTRRIEVDLPAGTYRYICDVPGHESMVGTLTVR